MKWINLSEKEPDFKQWIIAWDTDSDEIFKTRYRPENSDEFDKWIPLPDDEAAPPLNVAVESTLKLPLEANKGVVVVYDLVDGKVTNLREANAKELCEIVNVYRAFWSATHEPKDNG